MANNTGNIVIAALAGAAIGTALGVLFAPEKGAKTRRRLTGSAPQTAEDYIDDLIAEGRKTWRNAKTEGENAADDIEGYLAHIAKEGRKSWRKFQAEAANTLEEGADEAEDMAANAVKQGKNLWSDVKDKAQAIVKDAKQTTEDVADTVKSKVNHGVNYAKAELS